MTSLSSEEVAKRFGEKERLGEKNRLRSVLITYLFIHLSEHQKCDVDPSRYMMTISLPGKVLAICVAPNWLVNENPHVIMYIVDEEETTDLEGLTSDELLEKVNKHISNF